MPLLPCTLEFGNRAYAAVGTSCCCCCCLTVDAPPPPLLPPRDYRLSGTPMPVSLNLQWGLLLLLLLKWPGADVYFNQLQCSRSCGCLPAGSASTHPSSAGKTRVTQVGSSSTMTNSSVAAVQMIGNVSMGRPSQSSASTAGVINTKWQGRRVVAFYGLWRSRHVQFWMIVLDGLGGQACAGWVVLLRTWEACGLPGNRVWRD